jgi:two-component system chemotaxis response regulator CheV
MAGVLDGVDARTQLVGENRLELLLFRLGSNQIYGINVFKVQEVIRSPVLTQVPRANSAVRGIANMRGKTIPVIDLSYALGGPAMSHDDIGNAFVIIADYNRSVQGFLVSWVDRIVNMHWEEILPPPQGSGGRAYLTAVTRVDEKLVEIIDVEKVLDEIGGASRDVSENIIEETKQKEPQEHHVLVADDSSVARNQIKRTLDQVGIKCTLAKDGKEALDILEEIARRDGPVSDYLSLVISDVEMPNMDGYTLTTSLRKNPKFKDMFVILHTSLSGVFNNAMVKKVGADRFIPKFNPDDLANAVIEGIEQMEKNARKAG